MLDRSETILCGPETSFFRSPLYNKVAKIERVAPRIAKKLLIDEGAVRAAILNGRSNIDAFDRVMAEFAASAAVSKSCWAEKSPINCFSYNHVAAEDNDVFFVSMIRNGLDVVTSKVDEEDSYWCSVQRYVDTMEAIQAFDHPNHVILKYEDIVQSPIETLKSEFSRIGEPFTTDVITDFYSRSKTRDFNTVRQPKIRQSLSGEWVERWQRPEHKNRVREFFQHPRAVFWLERSGYPVRGPDER